MSKLKGSRLEAEVDRVRTDGNWKRLSELLPSVKSKNSGLEDSYDLFQAEIILETFLEQLGDVLRPSKDHYEKLKPAELFLNALIREKDGNSGVFLEANILLAKLQYTCVEFRKALAAIENSSMEKGNTPFRTLRALRLVAEGYAIKGLCLESIEITGKSHSSSITSTSSISNEEKALYCFEKSAELAISYINELEKTLTVGSSKGTLSSGSLNSTTNTNSGGGRQQEKIGEILERCLERVAVIRAKDTPAQRKAGTQGIEWYRKIITCLGDKTTGERLQQKMSKQLAELLLRSTVPIEEKSMSEAMSMKSQNLSFYTGSHRNYFAPTSRLEEIILLLLINEVLSTRDVVLSRSDDLSSSRTQSLQNAKSAYNLLTLVLSTLRQYHILATIYERAMKFANNDSFLWQQFALSSICRGRFSRAARVLEQSIITSAITESTGGGEEEKENGDNASLHLTNNPSCALSIITEYMMLTQIYIERFSSYSSAISYAQKAVDLCSKDAQLSFLRPRCQLLHAIAFGLQSIEISCWETRKQEMSKTVGLIEECVSNDPHDYLALYYAAFFHAVSRDLESAKERCSRSLALNCDQPAAVMLLALIFTAYGDLKGALELVVNALEDFETHYGLLVLRLHIEMRFGRVEQSLNTCTHLLDFWKKRDAVYGLYYNGGIDEDKSQKTMNGIDSIQFCREGSVKTATPSLGRELSTPIAPTTPLLPSFVTPVPLINTLPKNASGLDLSVGDSGLAPSEAGQSTISDSATSSGAGDAWSKFRTQADIWMCLAELYVAEGRHNDLVKCVDQAVSLFPHSHQAMYLKGLLLASKSEKIEDDLLSTKIRGEAKAAYLSALAISPNHAPSMSALAKLYSEEGNQKMAEHMLREMVRDDPLNCTWWQQLGCSLMRRGDAERATECLNAAAQLDRSTPLLPFTIIPLVFPTAF